MTPERSQPHVLLFEDDETLSFLIKERLAREGVVVTHARDGEEGLQLLQKIPPVDLILLDIQMPRKNGYEVLESLRAQGDTTPVVVISNSGQPVELERLASFGVVDFLVKASFDPQELITLVRRYLSSSPSHAQTPQRAAAPAPPLGEAQTEEGRRPRILLVEDDEFLADIMVQKLRQFPYDIDLAKTGEEAISHYDAQRPDCVLLDLLLPGVSGVEVLRHIRQARGDHATPVIVISNFSEEGHRQEVEQLGASRYLIKASVSPTEIARAVSEELGRTSPH